MKFKDPCRWPAVCWYSTAKSDTGVWRLVQGGPGGSSGSDKFHGIYERYDDGYKGARFDAYETIKLRQDGTEVREYFKWNDEGCRFEECQRPPALRYSRKVHACVQFVKGHLEI